MKIKKLLLSLFGSFLIVLSYLGFHYVRSIGLVEWYHAIWQWLCVVVILKIWKELEDVDK